MYITIKYQINKFSCKEKSLIKSFTCSGVVERVDLKVLHQSVRMRKLTNVLFIVWGS